MMPKHVYDNIKAEKSSTDKLSDVTMIYADICGFTNWSSGKSPQEVVDMLSKMFASMDKLCEKYDVYKVCTIGDCYVVMGYKGEGEGVRDYKKECMVMVEMAHSMVGVIKTVNEKHGIALNMRIGLHTGEVIAGITGTNLVRYDIYGPDAMIANKMESGGDAGKINISDTTKKIVEELDTTNRFRYEFNKKVISKAVNREHDSFYIFENEL
jgi:class 3 adenylate cyclase